MNGKTKFLVIVAIFFLGYKPTRYIKEYSPEIYAIENVNIYQKYGTIIKNATIIVEKGRIAKIGRNLKIPEKAYVIDYRGKWVYPGFIEIHFSEPVSSPYYNHWNKRITPDFEIQEKLKEIKKEKIESFRKKGVTSILLIPEKGILKGQSAFISLRTDTLFKNIIKKNVFLHIGFEYGDTKEEKIPTSLMGTIALIRQIFYDALEYKKNKTKFNPVLSSLIPYVDGKKKILFEAQNDIDLYRIWKLKKEFNLNVIIKGSGYEYRQLDFIKKTKIPLIIPLNFSENLGFENYEEGEEIPFIKLKHFELSKYNPYFLQKENIEFALTSSGTKSSKEFFNNIKKAIENGLEEEYVIKALTEIPAKIIGVYDILGSIEPGKLAHFVITDGKLFNENTRIHSVWIEDKIYNFIENKISEIQGVWNIKLSIEKEEINIKLKINDKRKSYIIYGDKKLPVRNLKFKFGNLHIIFPSPISKYHGFIELDGNIKEGLYIGKGKLPDGKEFYFSGRKEKGIEIKSKEKQKKEIKVPNIKFLPFVICDSAEYKRVLFKNAVIWTCSDKGILEDYDILIEKGKIIKIGKEISEKNDILVIDVKGKHITPGIIDAHSHIGVEGGVNETGDIISSEVRIEDVVNPYDINIYRVLEGGVTLSCVLHGSANPIGGVGILIKHKWGEKNPENLIFRKGYHVLKFALGENPKRKSPQEKNKFPATRIGVLEIIEDKLIEAIEYSQKNKKTKNLELENIIPIFNGKGIAYVHSYRQDEILMFMKIAKKLGIKNVSFQHAFEAYKIADKIRENNFFVSTHSDWWGYKFEAIDAIPYNGPLLLKLGIITSLSSDFPGVAVRLNTEASKMIKYGDITEEEALKMITIYPAIQLGIDKWVGSIEEGKLADLVIWDGNPLSPFSKVVQVWIEGKKYFDIEKHKENIEKIKKERYRIMNLYLRSQKGRMRPYIR